MPAAFISNCIEVALHAHAFGLYTIAHVLHFKSADIHPTAGECELALGTVVEWAGSSYAGIVSNEIVFDDATVLDRSQEGGYENVVSVSAVSTYTHPIKSMKDCICVALTASEEGRSHHGKMYLFPPGDVDYEDAVSWTVSYRDRAVASVINLLTNAQDAGVPFCVASPLHGYVTTITGAKASLKLATQKRRVRAR